MVWNVLVSTILLGAAPQFDATTLEGRKASGELVELDGERIVLQTAEGKEEFPLASLTALSRAGSVAKPVAEATLAIELVDESLLAAVSYSVADNTAEIALAGGARLKVPTRAINSVRFKPPGDDAKLAEQWAEILKNKAAGDILVTRKEDQLDFLEGILGDITAEVCNFEIDKESIPVKRTKVEGIKYFHPAPAELAEAVGQLHTEDGWRLSVQRAALSGDGVAIKTTGGIELTLPLEHVARLDLTSGKIAYLSDLDPESANYTPFFGAKAPLPTLADFYTYRRDIGFEKQPLVLDGKVYRKGLALQSRTVLVYKLPGAFRLFKTIVGIDDSTRAAGVAKVLLKADGKTVWEGEVRGSEPPRELDLDISGAKRLEIVADYGPQQDIGDRVDFGDARVTK